jgi:AraC-like DNA-binding protein
MIIGIAATLKQTLPTHDHELHEFLVCLNDKGELQVPGRQYQYKTGCTLFIPGGTSHSIIANESDQAATSFACFDWHSCEEHLHESMKPLVQRLSNCVSIADNYDEDEVRSNLSLANRLHEELQKQDSYSQSMAGSILTQLLVNHMRNLGFQTKSANSSAEQRIAESIEWIKYHLNDNINLDDMARRTKMSRSLYSRNFRAYTGMSLIAFTMTARLDAAAQLLAKTEDTIANIALSYGFLNIGHFHKSFKNRFRMTPNHYRRTARKQGLVGQCR